MSTAVTGWLKEESMIKLMSVSVLAMLVLAVVVAAADVSGKWSGQVPARGDTVNATFTFKVEGDKLSGTMTGPQGEVPLQEGKVSGEEISFSTAGNNAKILFTGKVAGDEIKMTRTREGGQGREFMLKRVK
jgi:hypothetical protein